MQIELRFRFGLPWFAVAALCAAASPARANEQVLKSFGSALLDGSGPVGSLVQGSDGALYGTTRGGGTNGVGTVFRVGPDGSGYQVLYSFSGQPDGGGPPAGLIFGTNGALYGLTAAGGASNIGTIFGINSDGSDYRVLHSFGASVGDGIQPVGALALGADGALYGATAGGGYGNSGTIFRLNQDGTGYSVVHHFAGNPNGGGQPLCGVVQGPGGALYGTTYGGGAFGAGIIFKLDISTMSPTFTLLHSFEDGAPDGGFPEQALTPGVDGFLYGTTPSGGPQYGGVAFRIKPDGTDYQVILDFSQTTMAGVFPSGPLLQRADGTLYGTTATSQTNGPGLAFSLQPDGTGFRVLHRFGSTSGDGKVPKGGLLLGGDNALYGVTLQGGSKGLGTAFRLTEPAAPPPPFALSIFRAGDGSFHISADGVLGVTYHLETSTDLLNWVNTGSVSNETGLVDFLDWNGAKSPRRFYRMLHTP